MSAAENPNVDALQGALELVDGFSQVAFGRIGAMATLALHSLETPAGCSIGGLDRVAHILKAIADTADDTMNNISCEVERMGCAYSDEAAQRRSNTQRLAMRKGKAA